MTQPNPQSRNGKAAEFVDSYKTSDEAWAQAAVFAEMLTTRGLSRQMGVTVKPAQGVFWIVLVKRA